MRSMFCRVLVFLALLAPIAAHAQTLDTAPPNNGSGGIFLDLQATNGPVTLTGFDTPLAGSSGATVSVEVWVRTGTYVGATGSSVGWTLSQTVTGVSRASNVNTPFLLATPITLPPGQVTAVYLHGLTSGSGLRYTGTGGSPPQTSFANADLTLSTTIARTGNVAFAGSEIASRAFSGTIRYTNALPTTTANNGSGGVFMNLQAVDRALAVTGFETYLNSVPGTLTSIEVWTRPGAYEGFTGSSAGWTLVETVSGSSLGPDAAAAFRLDQPIEVGPSAITAVYLHSVTASSGIRYTGTGASPPQTLWSNADLVLFSDRALTGGVPFGSNQFTPRAFAGTVLYTKAFTTARANNGDGGVFMNLTARDGGVSLTGFDLPLAGDPGVVATVEVWTRPGSYVGRTDSSDGWTLHQVTNGLTQGSGARTAFLMNTPLSLNTSPTVAVYLHSVTAGAGINYTGNTGLPPQANWGNSDLGLFSDVARAGNIPFAGGTFTPRTFSGVLRYSVDRMFRDGFED